MSGFILGVGTGIERLGENLWAMIYIGGGGGTFLLVDDAGTLHSWVDVCFRPKVKNGKSLLYELTDRKGHLLIKKKTKIDVQAKNDTDDLYEFDCWSRIAGHGSRLLKRFVLALLAIKLIYFTPFNFPVCF